MNEQQAKEDLVKYAGRLYQRGFVVGPGGNLSARLGKEFYISPHGLTFEELVTEDIVTFDLQSGNVIAGQRQPSWEFRVHRDIYLRESNIHAIIHVHPPYTIGLISGGMNLKPITPEFTHMGELPIIQYIIPAGAELHNAILAAVKKNNKGLLLKNHGFYTFGATIREAFYRAEQVEDASKTALMAKLAGNPRFLQDSEKELIRDLPKRGLKD